MATAASRTLIGWVGLPCLGLVIAGFFWPQPTVVVTQALNAWIFAQFGGFYLVFATMALILFIGVGLSPLGTIRLGGEDARPEFRFATWIAMLFCAGMGTGFLYWGATEPLYHFLNPPLATTNAETLAMRYTFFHWTLHPWAIYGLVALVLGFQGFNLKRGLLPSSALHHLCDRFPVLRPLGGMLNGITLLAILFGICATLGMGVLQLEGGLSYLLGWKAGFGLEALLLLAVTPLFIWSAISGIHHGIKWLSEGNLLFCLGLLAIIFLLGPHGAIAKGLWTGIHQTLWHLPEMSMGVGRFHPSDWVSQWTVKYWSWWIAWAPFVGIFIATISKGRTVRELVFGVLLVPTALSCLWFATFGEAAIQLQLHHQLGLGALNLEDTNRVLFQFLDRLSGGWQWLSWTSLVLVGVNFINSSDSATYMLSCLSLQRMEVPPPAGIQLFWGGVFALLTGMLLWTGGVDILQEITLVTVLPFSMLLLPLIGLTVWEMIQSLQKPLQASSPNPLSVVT